MARPKDYWKSWGNVKKEIFLLIENEKLKAKEEDRDFDTTIWPSKKLFQPTLYKHLSLHGGAKKVASKIGLHYSRKEKDFWKDFKNIEIEIEKKQKDLKLYPDYMPFKSQVDSPLRYGIEIHGGIVAVREKLGLKEQEFEGKWNDINCLFDEIRVDINDIGGHPNEMPRAKALRPSIAKAVQKHGTLREIADQMDLVFTGCSTKYWNEKRAKKKVLECQEFYKLPLDTSPTVNELIEFGAMTPVQVAFGNCTNMQKIMNLKGRWKLSENRIKEIDTELEKRGYIREGDWIGIDHPINYFCKKHRKVKATQPGNLLVGQSMFCCGKEKYRFTRTSKAAQEYDQKLSSKNKYLIRIENYKDNISPIKHKCIIHGEILPARPSNCLSGFGLSCCSSKGFDNIKNALNNSHNFSTTKETAFYIYQLKFYPEFYKLGIDSTGNREKDIEYGKKKVYIKFETRKQAFFLEQALLSETLKIQKKAGIIDSCPLELIRSKWAGVTEVRKLEINQLKELTEKFHKEMKNLKIWKFAIKYIPMKETEKQKCLENSLFGGKSP